MRNRELGRAISFGKEAGVTRKSQSLVEAYPAYPFAVEIKGPGGNIEHAVFSECTLPSFEVEVEEVKEGGYNSGTHVLPGRVKRGTVTLKHGLVKSSKLWVWYNNILQGRAGDRRTVSVVFYDNQPGKEPRPREVMRWNFKDAYPHKWSGPALNSASNEVAIESIELSFKSVSVE